MTEERLIKLGIEKVKNLNKDFDNLYEKYKKKAIDDGYTGELKFIKEHGKVLIYVVIWRTEKHTFAHRRDQSAPTR